MTTARRSWDVDDHPTLRAVSALDELVLRNVAEGIRSRRLAPEVHAALRSAGVYRMLVPRSAGGEELSYPLALRVTERLARVDGSVAWCAIIGAASNAFGDAQAVARHGLFGLEPHEALGRTLVTRRMAPRDVVDT